MLVLALSIPGFSLQYSVSGSTLTAVWLFQLPALGSGLELTPGFHPGPGDQYRLVQTYAQDVFVHSILLHPAH